MGGREPGQVRKEAATAIEPKCRGNGSPPSLAGSPGKVLAARKPPSPMSYQVLARKWRPRTFAELSGQQHVVRALANSIIVLRHGKVVEQGTARTVFAKPKTDYTKALLAAAFELEATRGGAVAI